MRLLHCVTVLYLHWFQPSKYNQPEYFKNAIQCSNCMGSNCVTIRLKIHTDNIIMEFFSDWGGQPYQVPALGQCLDDEVVRGLGTEAKAKRGQDQWRCRKEKRTRAWGKGWNDSLTILMSSKLWNHLNIMSDSTEAGFAITNGKMRDSTSISYSQPECC